MFLYKFKWESLSDSLFVASNGLFPKPDYAPMFDCLQEPTVAAFYSFYRKENFSNLDLVHAEFLFSC